MKDPTHFEFVVIDGLGTERRGFVADSLQLTTDGGVRFLWGKRLVGVVKPDCFRMVLLRPRAEEKATRP